MQLNIILKCLQPTYPVLGWGRDNYVEKKTFFNVDMQAKDSNDKLNFSFKFSLECKEVETLIKEGKAVYFICLTCSKTEFSWIETSQDPLIEISIDNGNIASQCEINSGIMTIESIETFSPSHLLSPYNEVNSYSLPIGSILAAGEPQRVSLIDKNATPIFKFVCNDALLDKFKIDFSKDVVQIIVDRSFYNKVIRGRTSLWDNLFYQSYYLTALAAAIRHYHIGNSENLRWVQGIDYLLQKHKNLIRKEAKIDVDSLPASDETYPEQYIEIAQIIIGKGPLECHNILEDYYSG